MELIQTLTEQLGVSDEQAQGGVGLLMKMAKEKLGGEDFGQIAEAFPAVEGLISSAPEGGGRGSALGGLAGALGGNAGQLGNLASLADGFKSLNMDTDMISKFIPVVLNFFRSQGGDDIKSLLEKVLD